MGCVAVVSKGGWSPDDKTTTNWARASLPQGPLTFSLYKLRPISLTPHANNPFSLYKLRPTNFFTLQTNNPFSLNKLRPISTPTTRRVVSGCGIQAQLKRKCERNYRRTNRLISTFSPAHSLGINNHAGSNLATIVRRSKWLYSVFFHCSREWRKVL